MIRYALQCVADHRFESWFQSATAFDGLAAAGHVTCPVCDSAEVRKSLMAPSVTSSRKAAATPADAPAPAPSKPLSAAPLDPKAAARAEALAALRREVEANSEYVGGSFALEARRIHDGTSPERAIYGEAKAEDARQLIEDGIPVAPLPFIPVRKTN